MRISVIGAGYVGLTTAVGFALRGHQVSLVDIVQTKVDLINQGVPPIYEEGLNDALRKVREEGLLSATSNHAEAAGLSDVVFLCVETPTGVDGESDLSRLKAAVRQVGECLDQDGRYRVVAVKSTVPPTTTEKVVCPILADASRRPFGLCANPEFLREGRALEDALNPDRIVIGAVDRRSGDRLEELYRGFDAPVVRTTPATAEMIKYASNALLGTAISFSNEIANICEVIPGVDVSQVMEALHLDRRLSPVVGQERVRPGFLAYLWPGCGYGGSCLPKDIRALTTHARKNGYAPPLLEAVQGINNGRPLRLVDAAQQTLGSLKGKKVAVLGLAFKPDTDDMRHSPAIGVVESLLSQGAEVRAYDPKALENARAIWANEESIAFVDSVDEALTDADVAIIVTAWPEFGRLSGQRLHALMQHPVVVDGRRILDRQALGPGIVYRGVGIGPQRGEPDENR